MESIREEIISEFTKLDAFRYINMGYRHSDRAILEESVVEELQHHCKGHQHSVCLKDQLNDLHGNGFVEICGLKHPYEPHDIYQAIEAVIENRASLKPFLRKNSLVYGRSIFHTHHSQGFYSMYNCIRHFKKKYKCDNDVWRRLRELKLELPTKTNILSVFANEVSLEAVALPRKTGEWLVFSKNEEKFKFLCLYIHDPRDKNDEGLYSLIKDEIETST